MDFRQLYYIITLEKHRNFTRAAEELHVAQTTLSQQIQVMEDQLGFKLFDRNSRSVKLTPAGHIFISDARLLVEQYENSVKKAQNVSAMMNGSISIGWWANYDLMLLSKALDAFHNLYPNVTFSLYNAEFNVLITALQNTRVDLLFLPFHYVKNKEGLAHKQIALSRLYALVSEKHRLADRKIISPSDLETEKIITMDCSHTPGASEKMFWEYSSMGFTPNVAFQVTSFQEMYMLVALNWGITFSPKFKVGTFTPELRFLAVDSAPVYTEVEAVWLERNQNPALQQFISMLQNNGNSIFCNLF
jgi:DNA-binding transcriptional LysR family regulator